MRISVVLGTLAFASLGASATAAIAAQQASKATNIGPFGSNGYGNGSLISICMPQCGFKRGQGFVPPEARKCVFQCVAAKKAAQH